MCICSYKLCLFFLILYLGSSCFPPSVVASIVVFPSKYMTWLLGSFFGHEDFSLAFLAACVVMCLNILGCAGSKTSCANSIVGWWVTKLVFLIRVCSTGVAKGWSASTPLVSSCESAQYLIQEYGSVYCRKFGCFAEEIKKSQLTCQYVFFLPPFFGGGWVDC